MMVPAGTPLLTVVTIEKLADPPADKAVATQLIVPEAPTAGVVQLHPAGEDIDWNVVFAGTTVLKKTEAASLGPLLLTLSVYVKVPVASTRLGEAEIATATSADPVIVGFAVTESLPRYVSPPPLVVAVLLGESGADCATVPLSVITG